MDDDLQDINASWGKLDYVSYSPTLTVGVSCDIEHFHSCYCYADPRSCNGFLLLQMAFRVRTVLDKTVKLIVADNWSANEVNAPTSARTVAARCKSLAKMYQDLYAEYGDTRTLPLTVIQKAMDAIEEEHKDDPVAAWAAMKRWRTENIDKMLGLFVEESPAALFKDFVLRKTTDNRFKRYYRSMFAALCSKMQHEYNEVVVEDVEDESTDEPEPEPAPPVITYGDIPALSLKEYDVLHQTVISGGDLDDIERWSIKRFDFDKGVTPYVNPNNVADIFQMVVVKKERAATEHLQNYLAEQRGVQVTIQLETSDAVYAEYVQQLAVRLDIVQRICTALGLRSSCDDETIIKREVIEDNAELDALLDEGYRRFELKDKSKAGVNQKTYKRLLERTNAILKNWNDSQLKNAGSSGNRSKMVKMQLGTMHGLCKA